ncbi:MAG: response regulator [Flavisolibacter sp.]
MKDKRKLLIVDDDADDRQLFIDAVKDFDEHIECVSAKDGKQALDLLNDPSASLPDYIFLDLRMPRFNGKKCLIEIKNNERLKKIPVIIYTTSRELEESKELKEMGAIHVISKPTNPEEVYYVVSFTLEEQWNASLNHNKKQGSSPK